MAYTSRAALNAFGFPQTPAAIAGPWYTRFAVVDVWDGTGVVSIVMHRPLSQSLLTSLLLQCDPVHVERYVRKKKVKTFKPVDIIQEIHFRIMPTPLPLTFCVSRRCFGERSCRSSPICFSLLRTGSSDPTSNTALSGSSSPKPNSTRHPGCTPMVDRLTTTWPT